MGEPMGLPEGERPFSRDPAVSPARRRKRKSRAWRLRTLTQAPAFIRALLPVFILTSALAVAHAVAQAPASAA
jgi:hypothetical protein